MKKFNYLLLIMLALMPLTLTSCDDDDDYWWNYPYWGDGWRDNHGGGQDDGGDTKDDAYWQEMAATLAGNWQGTTIATFTDSKTNKMVTVRYHTEINFSLAKDGATYGTGLQNDFEGENTTATYSRPFQWFIDTSTGDVHLQYFDAQDIQTKYEMVISFDDLVLDQRRFTGKIVAVDGTETDNFDWNYFNTSSAKNITITFVSEDED